MKQAKERGKEHEMPKHPKLSHVTHITNIAVNYNMLIRTHVEVA